MRSASRCFCRMLAGVLSFERRTDSEQRRGDNEQAREDDSQARGSYPHGDLLQDSWNGTVASSARSRRAGWTASGVQAVLVADSRARERARVAPGPRSTPAPRHDGAAGDVAVAAAATPP